MTNERTNTWSPTDVEHGFRTLSTEEGDRLTTGWDCPECKHGWIKWVTEYADGSTVVECGHCGASSDPSGTYLDS